jgi:hypothetical protein
MKRNKRVARDGFGGKKRSRSVAYEGWRPLSEEEERRFLIDGGKGKWHLSYALFADKIKKDEDELMILIGSFLNAQTS